MLCEKCRIREANIQITEIVNGSRSEHYYCMQCAKEMNFDNANFVLDGDFPLAKLLSGLLAQTAVSKEPKSFAAVTCPTCKTTYEDFIKNSKFGCPDCYKVFGLLIDDNIKSLQGSDVHKGKKPKHLSEAISENIKEDLADNIAESPDGCPDIEMILNLRKSLEEAVKNEEYEKAAELRDKIRFLEKGGGSDVV